MVMKILNRIFSILYSYDENLKNFGSSIGFDAMPFKVNGSLNSGITTTTIYDTPKVLKLYLRKD